MIKTIDRERFKQFGLEVTPLSPIPSSGGMSTARARVKTNLAAVSGYGITSATLTFEGVTSGGVYPKFSTSVSLGNKTIDISSSSLVNNGNFTQLNNVRLAVTYTGGIVKTYTIATNMLQSRLVVTDVNLELGYQFIKVKDFSYTTAGATPINYSLATLKMGHKPPFESSSWLSPLYSKVFPCDVGREVLAYPNAYLRFTLDEVYFSYMSNDENLPWEPQGTFHRKIGSAVPIPLISNTGTISVLKDDPKTVLFNISITYSYNGSSFQVPKEDIDHVKVVASRTGATLPKFDTKYNTSLGGYVHENNYSSSWSHTFWLEGVTIKREIDGTTYLKPLSSNNVSYTPRALNSFLRSTSTTGDQISIRPNLRRLTGGESRYSLDVKVPGVSNRNIGSFISGQEITFTVAETNAFYLETKNTARPTYNLVLTSYSMLGKNIGSSSASYSFDLTGTAFFPSIQSFSHKDINPKTVAFTGNDQRLVQTQSTLEQTVSASSTRGADIARINIKVKGNVRSKVYTNQNVLVNEKFEFEKLDVFGSQLVEIEVFDTRGNRRVTFDTVFGLEYFSPINVLFSATRINGYEDDSYLNYTTRFSDLIKGTEKMKFRIKEGDTGEWGPYADLTDYIVEDSELNNYFELLENHFLGARNNDKDFIIELVAADHFEETAQLIILSSGRGLAIIDSNGWAWQERIKGVGADGSTSYMATIQDVIDLINQR